MNVNVTDMFIEYKYIFWNQAIAECSTRSFAKNYNLRLKEKYSQTCLKRLPKGPKKSGVLRQVVS